MKLNINPDWLRSMAEKEANKIVSAGGLVTPIEVNAGTKVPSAMKPGEWSRLFPVKEMRRLRFSLPEATSSADALLGFFGVHSPDAWRAKWSDCAVAFRQTQKFDFSWEALAAWVREAEIIASEITVADFDEAGLRRSLDELRHLTRGHVQEGLDRAQIICSQVGIALVVVPELPGTRISGCTRWLSDKQAMVGLTLRYNWADQLWFTFFHELAHVLLHRNRRLFVVDNAADHMGDGTVDPDMTRFEEEADQFASDTLIPADSMATFNRIRSKSPTNPEIHAFAETVGVGPGIVVGRLQHLGVLEHWQGNTLRQKLPWDFVNEE